MSYDFEALQRTVPELRGHLVKTPDGRTSLDFANAEAVRLLNKALLLSDYGLDFWDLPPGKLCPGVPGRLAYVHALAKLIAERTTSGKKVVGLDVGTGASLIYPILGVSAYKWRFVASEVDQTALRAARAIVEFNPSLRGKVDVRQQARPAAIFEGIVRKNEHFAFTMCNPPFFTSAQEAERAARAKWAKLGRGKQESSALNFGGAAHELWTPGGEPAFLRRMISESAVIAPQVGWFTTLVSQRGYLKAATAQLRKLRAREHRIIELQSGNKRRRVLAWRF